MKLNVMLRASCLNCRHYNTDERAADRYMRQKRKDAPPVFCPEQGMQDKVCDKFIPKKADVHNAIWRAKLKKGSE